MARVKLSGLVSDIRGSFGGATFTGTRYGLSLQTKHIPRKRVSRGRNFVNICLARASQLWSSISQSLRSKYISYSSLFPSYSRNDTNKQLQAHTVFSRYHALRFLVLNDVNDILDFTSFARAEYISFDISIVRTQNYVLINFDFDDVSHDYGFLIYLSNPVNTVYARPSRGFVFFARTIASAINIQGVYGYSSLFGRLPLHGEYVQYAVQHVPLLVPDLLSKVKGSFRIDVSSDFGSGFNGTCSDILFFEYSLLINGTFSLYNSVSKSNAVLIDNKGVIIPSTFVAPTANSNVFHSAQLGNYIFFVGNFSFWGSAPVDFFAITDLDGVLVSSISYQPGFNNRTRSVMSMANDSFLVGGEFTTYRGVDYAGLVRVLPDGSIYPGFSIGSGFDGPVFSFCRLSSDTFFVTGFFSRFNGRNSAGIALLKIDGTHVTSFNPGLNIDHLVYQCSLLPDSKILLTGFFDYYGATPVNGICVLDMRGNLDTSFNMGSGFDNFPICSLYVPGHGVYVGGQFSLYNSLSYNNIILLNRDGSVNTSFSVGTGFNGAVQNIYLRYDSVLFVVGAFTSYNGVTVNNICQLDLQGNLISSHT